MHKDELMSRKLWFRNLRLSHILIQILTFKRLSVIKKEIRIRIGDENLDWKINYSFIDKSIRLKNSIIHPINSIRNSIITAIVIVIENRNETSKFFTSKLILISKYLGKDHRLIKRAELNNQKDKPDSEFLKLTKINSNKIANVQLFGSGIIKKQNTDEIYIPDSAANPSDPFVAGHWNKIIGDQNGAAKVLFFQNDCNQKPIGHIKFGIDATGRCSSNYWHSLIEYLPRTVGNASNELDFFLISANIPNSIMEAFRIVHPFCQFIKVPENDFIEVENLSIPDFVTYCKDSSPILAADMFKFDKTSILSLSKTLLSKIPQKNEFGEKIFLYRHSQFRNVANQNLLAEKLKKLGFTSLDPLELSFKQQVNLFRNAKILVSFGGATWANLIFCKKGTKVYSIVSEVSSAFDVHRTLAELFELDFKQVIISQRYSRRRIALYFRNFVHSELILTRKSVKFILNCIQFS